MRCDDLFSYTPSTWLEYLTQPTMIFRSSPDLFGYFEQLTKWGSISSLIRSPLNAIKNLNNLPTLTSFTQGNKEIYHGILYKLVKNAEQEYYVHSSLNQITMLAMIASIYRVLDLISISIQHSINRSKLSKTAKFMCSSIVSVMPYFAMEFMGHPGSELFIASSLRLGVSYLVSTPSLRNFIREIDLISGFKNFYLANFLYQNLAYGIRNLASTFLIEWLTYPPYLSITDIYLFFSKTAKIQICLNEEFSWNLHTSSAQIPLGYFTAEAGWVLGKMMVDSLLILLKRMSIIHDLRDPFAPVVSYFTAAQKAKNTHLKSQKQDHTPRQPQQKRRLIETVLARDAEYLHSKVPTDKPLKLKKAKKSPAEAKEKFAVNAEVAEQDTLDSRESVTIPGTNMTLVPLSSVYHNLWAVICTKEDSREFYKSLERPGLAVTGEGSLKFLTKNYYELKPPERSDYRALGRSYSGSEVEDALYYVVKKSKTYEDAMPAAASLCQEISSGTEKPLKLLVFDRIENHKEISKAVSR